jgi:hypothetical protein
VTYRVIPFLRRVVRAWFYSYSAASLAAASANQS